VHPYDDNHDDGDMETTSRDWLDWLIFCVLIILVFVGLVLMASGCATNNVSTAGTAGPPAPPMPPPAVMLVLRRSGLGPTNGQTECLTNMAGKVRCFTVTNPTPAVNGMVVTFAFTNTTNTHYHIWGSEDMKHWTAVTDFWWAGPAVWRMTNLYANHPAWFVTGTF